MEYIYVYIYISKRYFIFAECSLRIFEVFHISAPPLISSIESMTLEIVVASFPITFKRYCKAKPSPSTHCIDGYTFPLL